MSAAANNLKKSVEDYCRALGTFHARVAIKTHNLVKGILLVESDEMTDIVELTQTRITERTSIEDKFIVPYQRNPQFTGRKAVLVELKEKLYSQAPRRYNHRIALYGMGGVGKTQCALEYVYTNQAS
jgi:hypothetical protein